MAQPYNEFAGQRVARLEALSDGIFAFALTVLVLDLKIPANMQIISEASLLRSLVLLKDEFISYFLSFMTLGIFWTGQITQFQYIQKSDRNLTWICLFFLLFVSLIPLTTNLLASYLRLRTVFLIYWLNILLMAVCLIMQLKYASKRKLLKDDVDQQKYYGILNGILTAQCFYFFSLMLCLLNTYVSISFIILVQLNYAMGLINLDVVAKFRKP